MSRVASEQLAGTEIAIVGAGAIGAALAYRLSQSGAQVTIVEQRHAGAGTTGRSFAWVNGFRKMPREYQQLSARGIREHEQLRDDVGGDWLHQSGGLYWMRNDDADAVSALHHAIRQMREWGYRVDRATPHVVTAELEPDLAIDAAAVDEVFVCPDEGWVETVRMASALVQAARSRHGARLLKATVTSIVRDGRRVGGVLLDDGRTIAADVVVNAAGPAAAALAASAGVQLPMRREPGVLFVTEPAPLVLRHVVHAPECNVRPDGGGRVMVQREAFDTQVEEGDTQRAAQIAPEALAHAAHVIPALGAVRVEATLVGVRPMPSDGHPIVGFESDVAGLYHVVTHSGVTLCAVLARLVTEELSGGAVPELEAYRPRRFAAP